MQPERHDALPPAQGETDTQPGAETAAGQPDLPPTVEEQLRAAELKAAEHHDAWLRAKAEAENVRKRAQEDIAKAHKYGIERFGTDLLAVKDSLEAALAAENASVESMRSGVELTLRQLEAAFEKQQLREIDPAGEKFDPHRHQAISTLPSEKEPNTVINVLQKGYSLSDRVIRPALVTVAKPKDA
ncbi:MAG TPA: nucleotide exchange factor GrpE [Burkholderiales bacterium]|nr:nucleotide exchange factor GrpE [Burkholderiales bacterium]